MGYAIRLEIDDKAGALQRLLLLLGQRNVSFEYFSAVKDDEDRVLRVTLGLAADQGRAAWVSRQLSRHKDVMHVQMTPFDNVAEQWTQTASETIELEDLSHRAVEDWFTQSKVATHRNHGKISNLPHTGCTETTHTHHARGGLKNERKIILRRQRRSKVVGG